MKITIFVLLLFQCAHLCGMDDFMKGLGINVGGEGDFQFREIAEKKMVDLNAASIESAMSMIEGTAKSMGITVEGSMGITVEENLDTQSLIE